MHEHAVLFLLLLTYACFPRWCIAIVWEADPNTCQFTYVSPQAEAQLGYNLPQWLQPGFLGRHMLQMPATATTTTTTTSSTATPTADGSPMSPPPTATAVSSPASASGSPTISPLSATSSPYAESLHASSNSRECVLQFATLSAATVVILSLPSVYI